MEKSSFFDAVFDQNKIPDRRYFSADFARYFASFIGNGVFPNPSTNLQVVANDDMTVTVKAGKAWINGYWYENTDDLVLKIDVADGVLDRIDSIVLQYRGLIDDGRKIVTKIKKGQFSSNSTAPILQRDSDIFELKLSNINVKHGAIKITQADITDTRLDNNVCGIVTGVIKQADTTALYEQIQSDLSQFRDGSEANFSNWSEEQKAAFDTWLEGIKAVLDGDTAGNLLNLINEVKTDFNSHASDPCHIQTGEREKWNGKAEKSVTAPYSLLASKWVGEKSPFSYKFEYEKITKTSNQELIPSESISMAELSALQSANLTDAGQNNGYFMLQANGEKPKIDIPIRIIFRGDM